MLHLLCNWMNLKLIALDWLNDWRLHKVVDGFLISLSEKPNVTEVVRCIDPEEMPKVEPVIYRSWNIRQSKHHIRLGASLSELALLSQASPPSIPSMLTVAKQNSDNYILKVGYSRCLSKRRPNVILVAFIRNCSNRAKVKAYLHACLVGDAVATLSKTKHQQNVESFSDELELNKLAEKIGMAKIERMWPIFERCASKAGWKLDETELHTEGYEIQY